MSAGHARATVAASLLLLLGAGLPSCLIPEFDPAGRACPCLPGYHCDEGTQQCVPGTASTLSPVDDTYVRAGVHEYEAHGDETRLVCWNPGNIDSLSVAYLKFDLHPLPTPVAQATLVLYGTYAETAQTQAATFTAYRVDEDEWSAATLTYATRPVEGQVLSWSVREGNGYVELDVTSWVNGKLPYNRLASIMVKQTAQPDYWEFRSSRFSAPEKRPLLRLVFPSVDDAGTATPQADAATAD